MDTILVAGSRNITNKEFVNEQLDRCMNVFYGKNHNQTVTVIQGGAGGVDTLARKWALARGHKTVTMPADWERYGRSAGFIRNREMVEKLKTCEGKRYGVVIMNDGSRGSSNTVELLRNTAKRIDVVQIAGHRSIYRFWL